MQCRYRSSEWDVISATLIMVWLLVKDGLSISEPADLLGFSHSKISLLQSLQRMARKQKTSVSAGENTLLIRAVRGEQKDRSELTGSATVTPITTLFVCGEQKSISTRRTLMRMSYNYRRPCQNCTAEDWKRSRRWFSPVVRWSVMSESSFQCPVT